MVIKGQKRSNMVIGQKKGHQSPRKIQSGIQGPKPVGPRPSSSVLVLGPNRTRTSKIQKSRTGPGTRKFKQSRTMINKILKISDRSVRGSLTVPGSNNENKPFRVPFFLVVFERVLQFVLHEHLFFYQFVISIHRVLLHLFYAKIIYLLIIQPLIYRGCN